VSRVSRGWREVLRAAITLLWCVTAAFAGPTLVECTFKSMAMFALAQAATKATISYETRYIF